MASKPTGNPIGRPTKYKPEYAEELIKFFSVEPYREEKLMDKNGGERIQMVPNKFPTLARFACNIGVCKDTLYEWATAKNENGDLLHPEFSVAYKRSKSYQEYILAEGGMNGAFQANFAIFTAKNVIGWRDKMETENQSVIEYKVTGGLPD